MALTATLYRFKIELSDIDRGVYDTLDLRVAMHPSESMPFLLTRVLAFGLSLEDGLEFSPGGLSDTDEPCIRSQSMKGGVRLWIEIGNPSVRKLHKASKAAEAVKVFTYKDPGALLREISGANVHKIEEIEIYSFSNAFLDQLGELLQKDNRWSLVHTDGSLTISSGERSVQGEAKRHFVQAQ